MKPLFLKSIILAIFSLWCIKAAAYDCVVDGICYNLKNHQAEVTKGYKYSGAVTIPSTIKFSGTTYHVNSIGMNALFDCYKLTSVVIPSSVSSIGSHAFEGCSRLTSIDIPSNVRSIGASAFRGCSGLTSIVVKTGNSVYDSRNNCNAIIETASNTLIAGCKNTKILSSVTSIGDDAFHGCTGLTSITIPNSVTSIGGWAFSGCGLTSIVVESGNSVYDSRNNCNAIIETASNTLIAGCKNTQIPSSVTSIGSYAFHECTGLTSITIPNSVTSIGNNAFWGCTSVTDVYCYALPNQLTWDESGCNDFKSNRGTLCHVYDADEWKEFEGIVNVTFVGDLPFLAENADNSTVLNTWNGKNMYMMLKDRTLYTDDRWSTLCLPFDVDDFDSTPLEGFTVKELDTSTAVDGHKTGLENGTLYLNFKDATSIEAGKPYVVKKEMSYDISTIAYIPCTATSGTHAQTGFTDDTYGYQHLVDNKTDKYWRTNAPPDGGSNFCEFYAQEPVVVTRYELVSTNLRYTSNPTIWTLKAKLNEEDDWTVIDSRNVYLNPGDSLGIATSTKKYNIATGNQGAYKYFRFDVTKNNGATVMVISDLKMYGAKAEITSIENPIFAGVTIQNVAPTAVASEDGHVQFIGTFSPVNLSTAELACLYLDSNNKLRYPDEAMNINSLYAYFQTDMVASLVGDVNGDGKIDISDVVALVNIILSDGTDENSSADVNGDGNVDISDVVALVNIILSDDSPSIPKINKVITNVGIGY